MAAHPIRGRITGVALVATDDYGYRRHNGQQRLNCGNPHGNKGGDDPQGDWGTAVEAVVRDHLATQVQLSPRRVLTYQVRESSGYVNRHYRELDAVAPGDARTLTLVEIKCSLAPKALRKGADQLTVAADVLAGSYRNVRRVLAVVPPPWTPEDEMRSFGRRGSIGHTPLRALETVNDEIPLGEIGVLWLRPETLMGLPVGPQIALPAEQVPEEALA